MRILAFDPGKNVGNFAFAFLVDGKVECYGSVIPISTMIHPVFSVDADDFYDRMVLLKKSLGLTSGDIVLAERFSDRGGGGKGVTGEHINVMLGLMKAAFMPLSLELVMPATWKGWLARTYHTGNETAKQRTVVPNMWTHLRGRFPDLVYPDDRHQRMVIHEGDAIGMALWRYETSEGDVGSIDGLVDSDTIRIAV